jgi:hypothetical protein
MRRSLLALPTWAAFGTACLLSLSMSTAHAAPVAMKNGAYAGTFVRDCRTDAAKAAGSTVPDRCEAGFAGYEPDGVTPIYTTGFSRLAELRENFNLGGFVTSATATNALAILGTEATRSYIDASGAAGTLVLKQGAFTSQPYARVSGHSLGLQSFYYDGTGPATRRIENIFDFTSNVTPNVDLNLPGPGGLPTDPAVYAKTRVTVFSMSVADLLYDPFSPDFFDVQSTGFWGQSQPAASDFRLEGEVNNRGITTSGTPTYLDFTMTAGRFYFVESYLGLWARFGGVLDATHTFTSQLGKATETGGFEATTEGLVVANASEVPVVLVNDGKGLRVPEPGALALAALALGLIGVRRQRRQ